jgi:hypothetical protein
MGYLVSQQETQVYSGKAEGLRSRVAALLKDRTLDRSQEIPKASATTFSTQSSVKPARYRLTNGKGASTGYLGSRVPKADRRQTATGRRRSTSVGERTPPPVLRKRLDRPGRPLIPSLLQKENMDSSNTGMRIAQRMLPSRPQTAYARRPSMNSTLNSTSFSVTSRAKTLRNRIEDITMRNDSAMTGGSILPHLDENSRLGLDSALDALRRTPSSRMIRPVEGRLGSPIIPRCGSPFEHEGELNHMSRSLRELAGTPSPSSRSFDEQISRRKEEARLELQQKQRQLLNTLHVGKELDEGQVLCLDSMEIMRSSVSTLAELIRIKEAEVARTKSLYEEERQVVIEQERQAKEQERKLQQIAHLKRLEEEEAEVLRQIEAAQMDAKALSEKIKNQSIVIEKLTAQKSKTPSPVTPSRTVESAVQVFSIGTPLPGNQSEDLADSPWCVRETSGSEAFNLENSPSEMLEAIMETEKPLVIDVPCALLEGGTPTDLSSSEDSLSDAPVKPIDTSMTEKDCVRSPQLEDQKTEHSSNEDEKQSPSPASEGKQTVAPNFDAITDSLLDSLLTEIIGEMNVSVNRSVSTVATPTEREWKIPTRVDSFDLPEKQPQPIVEEDPTKMNSERVMGLVKTALRDHMPHLGLTDEISDEDGNRIREIDFSSYLRSELDEDMSLCVGDAFIELLDDPPPNVAADSSWGFRRNPARNPLAAFLPQRHSLASLFKELEKLIADHNKDYDDPMERIQAVYRENMKKFCIKFNREMFSEANAEEDEAIKNEIIDEVTSYIEEALFNSVFADFEFSNMQPGRTLVESS